MAFINERDIRHKDYIGRVGQDPQRLLWANVGLTYDFHETGDSETENNKVDSKRDAAPEIIALRIETSYNQCAKLKADSNRIIEEGAEMIVNTPIGSDFKEARDNGHKGRPISLLADVDFRSFSHVLPGETAHG